MEEDEYNADIDTAPIKRNRRAMRIYAKVKDTTPYVDGPLSKQVATQLKCIHITKRTGKTIRKNFHTEVILDSKKIKYTSHGLYHRKGICPCGCNRNQYTIYKYRKNFNRYFVNPSIDGVF